MVKQFCLLSLCLMIVACSGPSRKPNELAIAYALEENATLRLLAERCETVSLTAKQAAWRAKTEWWKRNGPFVEAADFGFAYQMVRLTDTRQETGARYSMGLVEDILFASELRLQEMQEDGLDEARCVELLNTYKTGSRDLHDHKQHYPLLVDMQQKKDAQGEDLRLKQAAIEVSEQKKYSRSSFSAEQLAKREGCPTANVTPLRSEWPSELFEARCDKDSFLLIQCEWGRCKAR